MSGAAGADGSQSGDIVAPDPGDGKHRTRGAHERCQWGRGLGVYNRWAVPRRCSSFRRSHAPRNDHVASASVRTVGDPPLPPPAPLRAPIGRPCPPARLRSDMGRSQTTSLVETGRTSEDTVFARWQCDRTPVGPCSVKCTWSGAHCGLRK